MTWWWWALAIVMAPFVLVLAAVVVMYASLVGCLILAMFVWTALAAVGIFVPRARSWRRDLGGLIVELSDSLPRDMPFIIVPPPS